MEFETAWNDDSEEEIVDSIEPGARPFAALPSFELFDELFEEESELISCVIFLSIFHLLPEIDRISSKTPSILLLLLVDGFSGKVVGAVGGVGMELSPGTE